MLNSIYILGSESCSLDATVQYSWDFAQQVHIPHHSQQVGPLYFKTAGGDVRYLEFAVKDLRNRCFAWVRHMLSSTLTIAKDNKNNAVLGYAVWRTLTGGHKTIQYSLMLAGHTKFSCDWHFGV
ncbi:uncharacterized protein LOC128220227 [Mya arenaria]|uniref:uncharacterized protein LOC128220227 n=1 Tax=Mya arenaria TaxID=6604 RepID=UPI0022DF054B|nr:uncharacterized protein LOC128220227 [Mya arenaria]